MWNRLIISIIGIPILGYIYYNGGLPLLIFVNLIIGVGILEFYTMAKTEEKSPYIILGTITALLIPNIIYFKLDLKISEILIFLVLAIMTFRVLKNKVENTSYELGTTILGIVYVSIFFSHMLLISGMKNGGKLLLTIQVLVWVCDSFAYFTGLAVGRKFFNRGFSEISPKKSIEGCLGGIFFTVLALYGINEAFNIFEETFPLWKLISSGIIIGIIVQIGDLAESIFKREFKVKDSGKILGEHGGILDRFDSLIFLLPVIYYLLKFL